MWSIDEALREIAKYARPLPSEEIDVERGVGSTLIAPLFADLDSPPHDKSLMDGYAIRRNDWESGQRVFPIQEIVFAGQVPKGPLVLGNVTRVMTGAPVPELANAVVRIEETREMPLTELGRDSQREMSQHSTAVDGAVDKAGGDSPAEGWIEILAADIKPQQNILQRARVYRRGDELLKVGHRLRPHDLGVLAEIGVTRIRVARPPRIAILATGDELVPSPQVPGPGQIRNSNGPLLQAVAAQLTNCVRNLGIAPDSLEALRTKIQIGLASDVLLLTGGVSAGLADLVPQALADCGVREILHKVAIKPGMPLWAGVFESAKGDRCLVFGLPGNPLSTLVCFEVFVKGVCQILVGADSPFRSEYAAELALEHQVRGPRTTYWPAQVSSPSGSGLQVRPLPWLGSSDLRSLIDANALIRFPPRELPYLAGEIVNWIPLGW